MTGNKLPQRALGTQGLVVPCLGLGCAGMSGFYGDFNSKSAQQEARQVLDTALAVGCSFLDSSDMYGPFTNEEMIGRVIKDRRDDVVIATKFGFKLANGQMVLDSSRAHVRSACEASLKRLGVDCIDLYYQHRVDPNTPIEETMLELKALVEEGKIKYIGISEAEPEDIRLAHSIHPISACQIEWSLFTRDFEEEIVPLLRELQIGIVAYCPLGRGVLTGKLTSLGDLSEDDYRNGNPRFSAENFAKNKGLVGRVTEIAASKGCTPGQVALAWLSCQGDDVVPIPGTKRIKYLKENIGSVKVALTNEDKKALNFGAAEVHGLRNTANILSISYGGKRKVAPTMRRMNMPSRATMARYAHSFRF